MAIMPRPIRLNEQDFAALTRLSHAWGPVQPLGITAVVREALRRCDEAETLKNGDARPAQKEKAR